ncbi:hypothetical protein TYRP_023304 [Tyrophagus putrescentiae]|nr:hypothetical protein TYRP_023304 [Tyrophagus putrescentiae]
MAEPNRRLPKDLSHSAGSVFGGAIPHLCASTVLGRGLSSPARLGTITAYKTLRPETGRPVEASIRHR